MARHEGQVSFSGAPPEDRVDICLRPEPHFHVLTRGRALQLLLASLQFVLQEASARPADDPSGPSVLPLPF